MSAKHTPGPWRVDPAHIGDIQTADGGFEIAAAFSKKSEGGEWVLQGKMRPLREADANARLIAAAPELLSALSDLAIAMAAVLEKPEAADRQHHAKAFLAAASAAIAKAEGAA